jgi:N-acetylglucosaminyldiphosphoundecaprenol N-acetyl-beta-D-mannosaminyltransferase
MKKTVLGVKINLVNRHETIKTLTDRIKKSEKLFFVITAYSEFFVLAQKDKKFKEVLHNADLVIPDGVGPLAAINYSDSLKKGDSFLVKLIKGLKTGIKILKHEVGETVPGVWLFSQLVELASKNSWRVFLLGGFGDVALNLKNNLELKYPNLIIKSSPGQQRLMESTDQESLEEINNFKPDLLFVAYGPIKQEKWIYQNKNLLKTKIAIGVGGTFDELTGKITKAPEVVEKLGLKWLWRLICEPKRLRRILNAFPIFPWLVFKAKLHGH